MSQGPMQKKTIDASPPKCPQPKSKTSNPHGNTQKDSRVVKVGMTRMR